MSRIEECILITGAARRLGRTLAEALAERGAALALHFNRSATEAEALGRQLEGKARRVWLLQADLRHPREQQRLAEQALSKCGRLTGLVNSAAVYSKTPLSSLDRNAWDEILSVNLTAPVWLSAVLGREMKRAGGGSIVQVGDWSVRRPYRDYLAYTVSKGALETATLALARELAPEVRVNMATLGPVLLPAGSTTEYEARVRRAVPLGRLGGPQAFVKPLLHLLLDASYCTGAIVTVDGGRSLM